MTTKIVDQLDRIAAICATIEGVRRAYANPPNNVQDLPCVVIISGASERDTAASDIVFTTRQYRLLLLTQSTAEGYDLEAVASVNPFFDRFYSTFDDRPGLWLTDNTDTLRYVTDCRLTSDGGYVETTIAGATYASVEFNLQVSYVENVGERGY